MVEGLIHFLMDAKANGYFKCIMISEVMYITHLLFVDDILIFVMALVRIFINSKKDSSCFKLQWVWL